MVNINNAHAGLSSASVLAKFDMEGFTSCPRLSPHSSFLSLFSTVSLPLHPSLSFSIPGSERQPYGSEAYSDRKMWPISSNWRSSGGWVSRGEGGGRGWRRRDRYHGRWRWACRQAGRPTSAASPTAPDSSMKAQPQSTGCPFTRTIIKRAGHPSSPPELTAHPVKS